MIDYSVPLSVLATIPIMLLIGVVMERGLIKHFYNRPHADQILVIEKGEITEQGSHEELMVVQGRYYKLYTQQSLSEFVDEENYWRT